MKNMILALALAFSVSVFSFCHNVDISQVGLDVAIVYVIDDVSKTVTETKLVFNDFGEAILSNEDGSVAFILQSVNDEGATLQIAIERNLYSINENGDKELVKRTLFDRQIVRAPWGKKICGAWLNEEGKPTLTITFVASHGDHGNEVVCAHETACEAAHDHDEVVCE